MKIIKIRNGLWLCKNGSTQTEHSTELGALRMAAKILELGNSIT
jgi:hypothetical protein